MHSFCQGTPPKNFACGGHTCAEQLDGASLNTPFLFRRRNYAPLSLVAIRACSSPCAVPRRAARLSRDRSLSRRENAETLVRSAFLRVFNENYPLSRSFSLRVVGVTPHTPAGVLYPHTPGLLLYFFPTHSFCQGTPPKNFACGGHTCAEQLDGASLNTPFLFRRRNYAPLSQTCTASACARSCKSRRAK